MNAKEVLNHEVQAEYLLQLADAAVAWWTLKRPLGYTQARHIKNPTINCSSLGHEHALAHAVATWVALGGSCRSGT